MTEKRFVREDDCYGYYTEIIDNEKELDLSLPNPKKNLTIEELVDLMNELADENEQLKSENQRVSEQKHIYKQDWKHLCIDKELLDSENEKLKSRVDGLKELNKIYIDFIVNEGYELADVMGKCDVE